MNAPILVETRGPSRLLTLNDPARANPLSPALVEALTAALEQAASDDGVRAVVLTGAGKHFSAGADLAALEKVAEGGDLSEQRADSARFERLFARLLGHPKLTVAAVNGAAVAGGCGLATACDLVVAERDARFAYTEVKIGYVPALVSTFLTRRVTGQAARRLLLDPEMLSADRAFDLGLADDVVNEGLGLERALEWAEAIARTSSPAAFAATKRLLNECVGLGWREALAHAGELNARQRLHPECARGVRSFLAAKTTPDWLEGD
jgi:methylglutaconyl-CoA hydratase